MKIKFVVLSTSQFGINIANAILDSGHEISAIISMPKSSLPNNSTNIKQYATQKNISFHEFLDINSPNSIKILRQIDPDYIFVSWPKIIGKEVLDIPKNFCIGTHPTALPFNRGRHPLHWIIDLGIHETKLSFFELDEGFDTGNILLQYPVQVGNEDTIVNINSMVNLAAYEGTKLLCNKLISEYGSSKLKQNHEMANYWRMRTPHDVTIDLRMPAFSIIKLVRSFTLPYPCANLIFNKYIIKIKKVKIVKTERPPEDIQRLEPGRIISVEYSKIIVKAGDNIIELFSINPMPKEIKIAKYIHPPSKYIMQYDIDLL